MHYKWPKSLRSKTIERERERKRDERNKWTNKRMERTNQIERYTEKKKIMRMCTCAHTKIAQSQSWGWLKFYILRMYCVHHIPISLWLCDSNLPFHTYPVVYPHTYALILILIYTNTCSTFQFAHSFRLLARSLFEFRSDFDGNRWSLLSTLFVESTTRVSMARK